MSQLLWTIRDLADAMPSPFETKGQYQRRVWSNLPRYPVQKIQFGMSRLKQQGLARESKKRRFVLELTLEGRRKLLIRQISSKRKPTRDGRSTIIIFDIPEEKRRHRAFLRRLLLKNGFMNLQKSVLISRFELPDEFFELLKELGLYQNVTMIKGQIQFRS